MKKKDIMFLIVVVLFVFVSINVYAEEATNCEVFDEEFITNLREYVYKPIKWVTPILFIVLTSVDFAKVVFSGDGKGMDKAKSNFLKRGVAALIIFFAPNIIDLLVTFVNEQSIASCTGSFK